MTNDYIYAILLRYILYTYCIHMMHTLRQLSYQAVFVVAFIVLFFPTIVDAQSNYSGLVIKAGNSPDIYYVGSDGKRYRFTDPETYLTWFKSFSNVVLTSLEELLAIPDGEAVVTARPGVGFIQIDGSNRLYALNSGAVLRWVKNEYIAKELHGPEWYTRVTKIARDNVKQYIIGQPISTATEYNAFMEREKSLTPNAELARRGFVPNTIFSKIKNIALPEPLAYINEISTNLEDKLYPSFDPTVFNYTLEAEKNDRFIEMTVHVNNLTYGGVVINGVPLETGGRIRLELLKGVQNIHMVVANKTGKQTIYNIRINRKANIGTSALLSELSENLQADLVPAFDPHIRNYEITARGLESMLRLGLTAESDTAVIKVNGIRMGSGADSHDIHLQRGKESVVKIRVYDGMHKMTYTLRVKRAHGVSNDKAKLIALDSSLGIGPAAFDPDVRDYYMTVDGQYATMEIVAKARDKDARVFINGKEKWFSTERIYAGETIMRIEIYSSEGAKFTYRIFVTNTKTYKES